MATALEPRHDDELPPAPPSTGTDWRRLVSIAVGVAALLAAAALWLFDSGDRGAPTQPALLSTTTSTEATTTSTLVPSTGLDTVLWPSGGSATHFATPEAAARSFAVAFLRFDDPLMGAFQQGDARSGEIPIQPSERGPVTTILVRQVGPDDDWSVLGAVTENIDVTAPSAGDEIASPVPVAGRALAFEGNVEVEVREDGELGAIGAGFVTGGGDEMRSFSGTVAFETPRAAFGALVFFTRSAENGQVWEAAAFRVAFRGEPSTD